MLLSRRGAGPVRLDAGRGQLPSRRTHFHKAAWLPNSESGSSTVLAKLWRGRPKSNFESTTFALARANRATALRLPPRLDYAQPFARSLPAASRIHLPNERNPALLRSDSDRRAVNFR